MSDPDPTAKAVTLLEDLGLKEYEARCYVALTRLPTGTAKEVSDISEVPRTRVYEAVRQLESRGLVATQNSNPQQFRAVPVSDAVQILRSEYVARLDELDETLRDLEPWNTDNQSEIANVWSLSGRDAIAARVRSFVAESTDEIIIILGSQDEVMDAFVEALVDATDRGVDTYVGTLSETVEAEFERRVPDAVVFESGPEWFIPSPEEYGVSIGRAVLVDGETLLLSSVSGDPPAERAIWGEGLENGLVVLAHHVASVGLDRQFER
ncbi:TrmB family transcriptional regulator [Haloarchaeobius amylolyticus]|uniref:TrmB family transcriptional regulator n=1 Tax=Haloarchaeobius amylolyticus TaxID=1198296 RepID=UPI00226F1C18|nr:helix-turn-helix domain-containing protein [Haloarchaeobius amylolyticus]